MAYNSVDKGLINSFEKAGGRKQFLKDQIGKVGSTLAKGAKAVNKLTGGTDLSKYAGEKLAKMTADPDKKEFVSQSVSGKDAAKSAGKVGMSMLSMVGAGTALKSLKGGIKSVGKMGAAKSAVDRVLKSKSRKTPY